METKKCTPYGAGERVFVSFEDRQRQALYGERVCMGRLHNAGGLCRRNWEYSEILRNTKN